MNTILLTIQVFQYLLDAGFAPPTAHTMTCIAYYESSLNPSAVNSTLNKDGSADWGLFQINEKVWSSQCDVDKLLDPVYNIKCAKIVYDAQGLDAWVAYKKHKETCDNYKVEGVFQ